MRRLVVVGNGMAGIRAIEEVLERTDGDMFDITVFGDEPYGNYNRILLSNVLAGSDDPAEIYLNALDWYSENRIDLKADGFQLADDQSGVGERVGEFRDALVSRVSDDQGKALLGSSELHCGQEHQSCDKHHTWRRDRSQDRLSNKPAHVQFRPCTTPENAGSSARTIGPIESLGMQAERFLL